MAATKKSAAAKKAVKKAAPKAAVKKVTAKKTTAKKAVTKKAPAKGATKKAKTTKVASIKLSPKQTDTLKRVHGSGEVGYTAPKAEIRSLESLVEKKLLKKGAKNKLTGSTPYKLTKLGQKHATAPAPAN